MNNKPSKAQDRATSDPAVIATRPIFPSTLHVATPAEGHALAVRLATALLQQQSTPLSDVSDMLRRQPAAASLPLLTVVYFHAITLANHGWVQGANS